MGNMFPKSSNNTSAIEDDDGTNGYCLRGVYIPEDVLIILLSRVDPKQLLNCKLVCKTWNRIIKSRALWHEVCLQSNVTWKCLPWYLYYAKFATDFFDTNLIKNGNGQEKFDHWVINPVFSGDGFVIENEPSGSCPLPEDVDDFRGHKSCFATSFGLCSKQQVLKFKNSPFKRHIINKFKPTIIVSEWFAPRFDCSARFKLVIRVVSSHKNFNCFIKENMFEQWTEGIWEKFTLEINDYDDDIDYIVYQHDGQDGLFWKGHYGVKMAGASLKFSFDSIAEQNISEEME